MGAPCSNVLVVARANNQSSSRGEPEGARAKRGITRYNVPIFLSRGVCPKTALPLLRLLRLRVSSLSLSLLKDLDLRLESSLWQATLQENRKERTKEIVGRASTTSGLNELIPCSDSIPALRIPKQFALFSILVPNGSDHLSFV